MDANYDDLIFTNAMVLTSGVSLNEVDLPPHSGEQVVFDSGPGMRIDFENGAYSVSGYFTYFVPLTLSAYDAANNLLGSVSSVSNANYIGAGGTANELLQFSSTEAIDYITLLADPLGGSFTLDDFTYDSAAPGQGPAPVSEPNSLILLGSGALGLCAKSRLRKRFDRLSTARADKTA